MTTVSSLSLAKRVSGFILDDLYFPPFSKCRKHGHLAIFLQYEISNMKNYINIASIILNMMEPVEEPEDAGTAGGGKQHAQEP